jgi:hypothetical protein
MANRLQIKRGTTTPGNIFYAGEPVYNETGKVLYIGDTGGTGTGAGSVVASNATYLSALEMLYKSSSADSGSIRFYEDADNGVNFITLKAPAAVTTNITLTLPDSDGDANQVLKTDGSGNLSWANQPDTESFVTTSSTTTFTNKTFDTAGTGNVFQINGTQVSAVTGTGSAVLDSSPSLTTPSIGSAGANFAGSTSGTTALVASATASGSLTLPAATDTLIGKSTTDTLTNKTFDANGTGNSLSNVEVADFAGSAIITAAEGVGSNNNDTSIPTTAAVKAYVDAVDVTTSIAGDSGTGTVSTAQTLTVSGTANEIETSVSNQTITIGLPNNVTITNDLTVSGNLRVVGTAVTFETQTVRVEDRLLELGLINNAAPTVETTWDTGVAFNYFQTSAKKSGLIWLNNQFMAMLSEISEVGDTGTADPQITATAYAPVAAGGLYIGGIASANEVINSSQAAVNLTFDGGSY